MGLPSTKVLVHRGRRRGASAVSLRAVGGRSLKKVQVAVGLSTGRKIGVGSFPSEYVAADCERPQRTTKVGSRVEVLKFFTLPNAFFFSELAKP